LWTLNDTKLIICTKQGDIIVNNSLGEFEYVMDHSPKKIQGKPVSLEAVQSYSQGFVVAGDLIYV